MKVKVSKEEIQEKVIRKIWSLKELPDFIELEAEIVEEKKCKCANLENGDFIQTDKEGKCVVCGRDWNPKNFISEPLKEIEELKWHYSSEAIDKMAEKIDELIKAVNLLIKQKYENPL